MLKNVKDLANFNVRNINILKLYNVAVILNITKS